MGYTIWDMGCEIQYFSKDLVFHIPDRTSHIQLTNVSDFSTRIDVRKDIDGYRQASWSFRPNGCSSQRG
jgi:hypothetical protein